MNAKEFLIQEFKKGNCDDITSNPEPDFSLPFYTSITRLMELYNEVMMRSRDNAKGQTTFKNG